MDWCYTCAPWVISGLCVVAVVITIDIAWRLITEDD